MRVKRRDSGRPGKVAAAAAAAAMAAILLTAFATPARAVKTDIVMLRNGDRITCEIDRLERGRLTLKTDDIGTVAVEWDKVAQIMASATFEIEDLTGVRYYAVLAPPPRDGELNLARPDGQQPLDMRAVVRISRLGDTFWKRLDGSIDVGGSYTSASELFKIDAAFEAEYVRPGYEVSNAVSASFSHQPGVDDVQRASASLTFLGRRANRWLYFGQALLERNRELGFDLRSSVATGAGRYLIQRSKEDLLMGAGLSVGYEVPIDGDNVVTPEFLVTLQFDRFSYDFPNVDVSMGASLYKSLGDWERVRVELSASMKRELFADFNVTLRAYESFDNRPPSEGAEHHDYGLTLSLGYSF